MGSRPHPFPFDRTEDSFFVTTAMIPVITEAQLRSTAPHPGDKLSRGQRVVYIIILGALTALGPFTIDLYLPAFPTLESELGVSAAAIQLTLTGTMIGFGFGQLIVGPWSDKVGRRLPLLLATAFHVLACVGAALSSDIIATTAPQPAPSWRWPWCATSSVASRS
jgi:DHA1 family bicyclomycin/chloramphenicol resistance-like MFS transporter